MKMTMDRAHVDDYVRGRLADEDLEAFEIEMLDSPSLQNAVMESRMLHDGMKAAGPEAFVGEKASRTVNFIAIAASVLLVLSFVLHLLRGQTGIQQVDSIVYVETLRGDAPTHQVSAGRSTLVSIELPPDAVDQVYRVSLAGPDGTVLTADQLRARDLYLNVVIPPLTEGDYELLVLAEKQVRTVGLRAVPSAGSL